MNDEYEDPTVKYNKMGIIGYDERRARFYKYNPDKPVEHPSYIPTHQPINNKLPTQPQPQQQSNNTQQIKPFKMLVPTQKKTQNSNNIPTKTQKPNTKNTAIGIITFIMIIMIIFFVVSHIINNYLNIQDMKYFIDKADQAQKELDTIRGVTK